MWGRDFCETSKRRKWSVSLSPNASEVRGERKPACSDVLCKGTDGRVRPPRCVPADGVVEVEVMIEAVSQVESPSVNHEEVDSTGEIGAERLLEREPFRLSGSGKAGKTSKGTEKR